MLRLTSGSLSSLPDLSRHLPPLVPSQHNHLHKGMDINVTGLWERNITGRGVTVVVVDDGVEHTHKDIHPNYSAEGSYDLNSNDPDPMPHPDVHSDNHHGTRCAGEIAAVPNNSFCAVGVAYGSKVAGIRVLDGPLTDSLEAIAFNKHYQVNDIYSCRYQTRCSLVPIHQETDVCRLIPQTFHNPC
ncbi:Proprotein convertase subtilisin/kexin type 7 [Liparis tanakae]|uniref:Proprotein convertase subtilisin/kexin type 7 n=1 Tax=Liparis tanakae TaxID=230148 RepID=A0A4Z2E6Q1_9TELE|nr:Proprotein convertase subtilisin/kexin type 7 [Liparis tanakae]